MSSTSTPRIASGRQRRASAAVIGLRQSGTLRLYANRLTVRYDYIPQEWLGRAIGFLDRSGHPTYVGVALGGGRPISRHATAPMPTPSFAGHPRLWWTHAAPVTLYRAGWSRNRICSAGRSSESWRRALHPIRAGDGLSDRPTAITAAVHPGRRRWRTGAVDLIPLPG